MDPLAGSSWSAPNTVAGFARAPANENLLTFAAAEIARVGNGRLLDIGCGAARNAMPLAQIGWSVVGTDLSWPMLRAAGARVVDLNAAVRLRLALAPMDHIPVRDQCIDFVVAHGIWNLAPSAATFRRAVAEAARVARAGAPLFVFTFSRHTLPSDAQPVLGERFVFNQFSGEPQCFLTEDELVSELDSAGFMPEPGHPIREYNRPQPGQLVTRTGPVIYEGVFRRRT